MSLPPLTPESILEKAKAYLRIQNFETERRIVHFCEAQAFSLGYLRDCLLHHLESGRKVYQKWNIDGSALLPACVMQLNLELPDTTIAEAYLQLAIVARGREKLLFVQLHGHTTTPLPR